MPHGPNSLTRAQGRRKSKFPGNTAIPDDATLDFVSSGVNFKITKANFITALGATGTIVQDGPVTAVPVLDTQGTVHNIRNLVAGTGIQISIGPENGIIIALTPAGAVVADTIIEVTSGYSQVLADDFIVGVGTLIVALLPIATAVKSVTIKNNGVGTVTIDPDGTETIDGVATLALAATEARTIIPVAGGWITV